MRGCRSSSALHTLRLQNVHVEQLHHAATHLSSTLTRLDLQHSNGSLNDTLTATVSRFVSLTVLSLPHADISDAFIIQVSTHCSSIQQLTLKFCGRLTDASLFALTAHCHALTCVDVTDCVYITDAGMCALATLPRLSSVTANYCEHLTDVSACALLAMPLMTHVLLTSCERVSFDEQMRAQQLRDENY